MKLCRWVSPIFPTASLASSAASVLVSILPRHSLPRRRRAVCPGSHLYTALTMGDPGSAPPERRLRSNGPSTFMAVWEGSASPIQLVYPGISPLLRQSSSMIHKRQTSPNRDCPFSPGARGTQTTGIKVILTTSTVYVPVFSMKCGRGQGLVRRWWWQGASSDWMQGGLSGTPCSPQREGFEHACGNSSFLQVWEVISYCKMIL